MAKGYKPEIIEHPRVMDLTKNHMRVRPSSGKNDKPVEKRYSKLSVARTPFLERAREFATYTIPNMFPVNSTGNQGGGVNTTGWQSFGAECLNNVTNKYVMTLFPTQTPFARLELTPKAREMLVAEDLNLVEEEGSLINAGKQALLEHERLAARVALGQSIEHAAVGGTTCIYMPDGEDGNLINYPLTQFVNRLDKSGNLLELIIEESKAVDIFDPAVQAIIRMKQQQERKKGEDDNDEVKLYTRCILKQGFYHIEQEVLGEKVGEVYRVKKDNLPFIVYRWKTNYGEHYGRSLVEQYAGDFHVIQFLSEAMAKGMILMADVKYLVRPGSVTDVDHLISSPTGEFVYGNREDIGILQLEKYADFTPIANVLDKYERRVGRAFLLGQQRDAERVTAYEVRKDALTMEQAHGGTYSMLASVLQKPYFQLLLNRIDFQLPATLVETVITTGIEALSKMGDTDKFVQWSEIMAQAATLPDEVRGRMKWGDFGQHIGNQLSLELPFIMSDKEYQEQQAAQQKAQQQAQMMEAATKAAPQMMSQAQQPK